jgi:hypothetical protein
VYVSVYVATSGDIKAGSSDNPVCCKSLDKRIALLKCSGFSRGCGAVMLDRLAKALDTVMEAEYST